MAGEESGDEFSDQDDVDKTFFGLSNVNNEVGGVLRKYTKTKQNTARIMAGGAGVGMLKVAAVDGLSSEEKLKVLGSLASDFGKYARNGGVEAFDFEVITKQFYSITERAVDNTTRKGPKKLHEQIERTHAGVASVIMLMESTRPGMTPDERIEIIGRYMDDLTGMNADELFGDLGPVFEALGADLEAGRRMYGVAGPGKPAGKRVKKTKSTKPGARKGKTIGLTTYLKNRRNANFSASMLREMLLEDTKSKDLLVSYGKSKWRIAKGAKGKLDKLISGYKVGVEPVMTKRKYTKRKKSPDRGGKGEYFSLRTVLTEEATEEFPSMKLKGLLLGDPESKDLLDEYVEGKRRIESGNVKGVKKLLKGYKSGITPKKETKDAKPNAKKRREGGVTDFSFSTALNHAGTKNFKGDGEKAKEDSKFVDTYLTKGGRGGI